MDKERLLEFIAKAHKAGYAAGELANEVKNSDGSTTITYKLGPFSYHDNYFGGEPFGGREVVFFEGKPVWIMVYYGAVEKEFAEFKTIYAFLQKALKLVPANSPSHDRRYLKKVDFDIKILGKVKLTNFQGRK